MLVKGRLLFIISFTYIRSAGFSDRFSALHDLFGPHFLLDRALFAAFPNVVFGCLPSLIISLKITALKRGSGEQLSGSLLSFLFSFKAFLMDGFGRCF